MDPHAQPMRPLSRERCIQMLKSFADGTYQSIDPSVCGVAAKFLQASTPNPEPIVPDYTAMSGPEMLAACRDDGSKWATAFCQHLKKHGGEVTEELMLGWFANAIENSHDVRVRRAVVLPDGSGCFVATVG